MGRHCCPHNHVDGRRSGNPAAQHYGAAAPGPTVVMPVRRRRRRRPRNSTVPNAVLGNATWKSAKHRLGSCGDLRRSPPFPLVGCCTTIPKSRPVQGAMHALLHEVPGCLASCAPLSSRPHRKPNRPGCDGSGSRVGRSVDAISRAARTTEPGDARLIVFVYTALMHVPEAIGLVGWRNSVG